MGRRLREHPRSLDDLTVGRRFSQLITIIVVSAVRSPASRRIVCGIDYPAREASRLGIRTMTASSPSRTRGAQSAQNMPRRVRAIPASGDGHRRPVAVVAPRPVRASARVWGDVKPVHRTDVPIGAGRCCNLRRRGWRRDRLAESTRSDEGARRAGDHQDAEEDVTGHGPSSERRREEEDDHGRQECEATAPGAARDDRGDLAVPVR